jgi:membrane fusion protein, multidrug efflux system
MKDAWFIAMGRVRRSAFLASMMIVAAFSLPGCKKSDPDKGAPPAQGPPPAVTVTEAVKKNVPIWGDFVARTAADEEVELRARVEGFLEKVNFDTGQKVKAGDVVFEIEKNRYKATVESAKARVAKAESDLLLAQKQVKVLEARAAVAQNEANLVKASQDVVRIRPLVEQKAVSKQDLDAAVASESVAKAGVDASKAALQNAELTSEAYIRVSEADVLSAKAVLTNAELDLAYTTIKAPIGGEIGQRNVDPGNLVGRGDSTLLATIVKADPILVHFSIPETDYLRLKQLAGSESEATSRKAKLAFELLLADGSKYPKPGKLHRVEATVDAETSMLSVEASFPNPEYLLKPGQFGRVRVVLEEREGAIVIPQRSVVEIQGAQIALVVDAANKVVMRTLTIADRTKDSFVVSAGLEEGERVIVEGVIKVRPGMVVSPTPAPAPAPDSAPAGEGK